MVYILDDDISDSYCKVEAEYDCEEAIHDPQTFLLEIEVDYTRIPEPESDGEADYMSENVERRSTHHRQEYGLDMFIGQDDEQIKGTVCGILYAIRVPAYRGIVKTFTEEIESIMKSPLEKLKKIKVKIEVVATMFPEDEMIGSVVKNKVVAGANVEAAVRHDAFPV